MIPMTTNLLQNVENLSPLYQNNLKRSWIPVLLNKLSSNSLRLHCPPLSFHIPGNRRFPLVYYSNAKYEEISCKPIKLSYDGTEENLIPFLTHLDIRRQNEGWAPATYIMIDGKSVDLTCHFTLITSEQATNDTEQCWKSPNITSEKHTVGHPTYNPVF